MIGSQGSTRKNTRTLAALFVLLALIATACGGTEATETVADQVEATASVTVDDGDTDSPVADADGVRLDEAVSSAPETVDAATDDVAADEATNDDAAVDEADDQAETDSALEDVAEDQSPLSQVLSFALQNSETQSYSFTQGMDLRMSADGFDLDIVTDGPFVSGEVEGDNVHLNADIGVIMEATFDSLGIDVTAPPFNEIFAGLGDAGMEMWADESSVVIDMSELAAFTSGLDPTAGAELAAFANGPVKIDLTQLDGVDATGIANQFGQGAQVVDPAQLLQALRDVDAVTETGTDSVNGRDVRVFVAELSMADYYAALDIDLDDQLNAANLGDLSSEDAEIFELFLPALEDLSVGLVVMIDDQDLVRRMETNIDMGELFNALLNNPELLGEIAATDGVSADELQSDLDVFGGESIEMTIDSWQEFDNYGASFGIVLPDAVDVTNELNGVLGN